MNFRLLLALHLLPAVAFAQPGAGSKFDSLIRVNGIVTTTGSILHLKDGVAEDNLSRGYIARYDAQGRLVEQTFLPSGSDVVDIQRFVYQGCRGMARFYSLRQARKSVDTFSVQMNDFDSNCRMVRSRWGLPGKQATEIRMEYDGDGRMVREQEFESGKLAGTLSFSYPAPRVQETKAVMGNGALVYHIRQYHDSLLNRVRTDSFDASGTITGSELIEYRYHEGRVVEKRATATRSAFRSVTSYWYNEAGLPGEIIERRIGPGLDEEIISVYRYRKLGWKPDLEK